MTLFAPALSAKEPIHLIHIGWAKAGSTFLQGWFDTHPQMAFARGGIAGFGSVFDLARQVATVPEIRCRVTSSEALGSPHPLIGLEKDDHEPLARYDIKAARARGCRLLGRIFPSARILIVTRGFRSALLSAYSQYVRTGGNVSFATYCGIAADAVDWWDYDHVIRLYEETFGAANLLVLPYELLRDDVQVFCRAIEQSLGLDPGPVSRAPLNPAIGGASLAWYPHLTRRLGWLRRGSIIRRLYWRAIMGDRLSGVAAMLQRIRPLPFPGEANIPPSLIETLSRQCESLRNRPSHARYLGDYGLADARAG